MSEQAHTAPIKLEEIEAMSLQELKERQQELVHRIKSYPDAKMLVQMAERWVQGRIDVKERDNTIYYQSQLIAHAHAILSEAIPPEAK